MECESQKTKGNCQNCCTTKEIIDVEEEQEQEVVNVVANEVVQQQGSTEELDDYVSDENDNDDDVEFKATYNDRMALANKMYKEFAELFQLCHGVIVCHSLFLTVVKNK